MNVDGGGTIETGARRCTRTDRLVVLHLVVAEGQVVHGALRRAERAKSPEQSVGNDLAGLGIAGDDGSGITRRQHRAFWDDNLKRAQTPSVERDRRVNHHPENIKHGGARHRLRRVKIVRLHRAGAGEIDSGGAPGAIDGDGNLDRCALVGFDPEFAVIEAGNQAAHALFGVVLDVTHIGLDGVEAKGANHFFEFGRAAGVGGNLRFEIGDVLGGLAGWIFGPF